MKKMLMAMATIGLFTAALAAGCGSTDSEPVTSTRELQQVSSTDYTQCPDGQTCFQIEADGNITHIFVDTDCPPDQVRVFVDGVEVTHLHDTGGPCHDIERTVWFPLSGNQSTATVCVLPECAYPGDIEVGYKVAGDCFPTSEQICSPMTYPPPYVQ